jgi:excisionase family DNA binding protein
MLTLGQAAKETGVSKPTISKAINKGRLSATKNEKGEYEIDPAELFRVFPIASKPPVSDLQSETHIYTNDLQRELDVLREERTRERQQLETTISDLRAERERLLSVIEEQAGSVKQLTYQPKQEPTANQNDRAAIVRPWLLVVLALAGILAAGAVLYFRQQ